MVALLACCVSASAATEAPTGWDHVTQLGVVDFLSKEPARVELPGIPQEYARYFGPGTRVLYGGIARGATAAAVRAAFPAARRLVAVGGTTVWATTTKSQVVVGIANGVVGFLAVYDRAAITPRQLAAYVRRSA